MRKKANFTLMELLLVLSLIACVTTIAGFALPRFLTTERFDKEVRWVEQKVALAQELAMDLGTTVQLTMDVQGITMEAYTPLPRRWLRPSPPFRELRAFSFEGARVDSLRLIFDGELWGSPRGVLMMEGDKNSAAFYLPGYPGRIVREKEAIDVQDAPYPQELLSHS